MTGKEYFVKRNLPECMTADRKEEQTLQKDFREYRWMQQERFLILRSYLYYWFMCRYNGSISLLSQNIATYILYKVADIGVIPFCKSTIKTFYLKIPIRLQENKDNYLQLILQRKQLDNLASAWCDEHREKLANSNMHRHDWFIALSKYSSGSGVSRYGKRWRHYWHAYGAND